MKVLLCCILKMENHYLEEWVRHYINLGIDKIVIYDNNDIDGQYAENIEDIKYVKEQKDNGIIDIYKIPNETSVQIKYYNECYKKYSEYDWLVFLDIDEYLILEKHVNIKDFLSQDKFCNYDIIHLNWKTYTDNEKLRVENDDYSLFNRFTTPCKDIPSLSKRIDFEIKSIVRGGISKLEFTKNPHTMDSIPIPCCDVNGNILNNKDQKNQNIIHTEAWINHYICKTIEEYCKNKLIRLGGHTQHKHNLRYTKNFFFMYNQMTKEKLKLYNSLMSNINPRRNIIPVKLSTTIKHSSPVSFSTYSRKLVPTENVMNNNEIKKISILKSSLPIKTSVKLKQIK